MPALRLLCRAPMVFAWTVALWFVRLAVWPIALVDPARDRRCRRALLRVWARGLARLLGMRVVVEGPTPTPPYYLVANHLSYMDIILICHVLGCAFVSRGDLAHWPVIGWMARSMQVIFIDRESRRDAVRVNQRIEAMLAEGEGVTVFPEGGISRGHDVEPFKSPLIEPAVANGYPVHYATINYATRPGMPPANRAIGWWRPEPFFPHAFRLMGQPGFTASIRFGQEPIRGEDRKQLARALHAAVHQNFTPMD